jgi:hypothetical protein
MTTPRLSSKHMEFLNACSTRYRVSYYLSFTGGLVLLKAELHNTPKILASTVRLSCRLIYIVL